MKEIRELVSIWLFQVAGRIMILVLERLAGRRRLFTVYLWGKPLAPSGCEENSGRGQNSPVDKPLKRPAWEPRSKRRRIMILIIVS
jgi:hypothetical protein